MINVYAATYLWPAPGVSYISTYYSVSHPGIDIAANGDHEVVAAREGTVKAAASTTCQHISHLGDSCNWGMGNYVQIQHSDGTYATYMHMRYGSITVSVGQYVEKGTKIGMMGSSGNSSGQHLHFQVGTSATNTINVNPSVLTYEYSYTPNNGCCFQVTATDGINIRNGAGTSYTVVGAITYNAYFYITERKQANGYTWGKVDNYNGVSGWCVLDYAKHVNGTLPDLKTDSAQPIHTDNNSHVRNGYFTFKNAQSGTFMNVWGGANQNGTAITTYTFDDSIAQRFNVVHKGNGKYKLYAECSDQGTNKVVDVLRNDSALADGQAVDLYDPNDDTAQLFYIVPLNDGSYVFEIAAKEGYVIAPASASVAGSNTKDSQLKLQKYTGANYQKWKLCNNNGKETTPNISYNAGTYKIETDGYPLNMRSNSNPSSSLVTSIPDKTTLKITNVNNNWGYTTYNGISGWVCLDFTVYTVELDSISVLTNPEKLHYLVGEHLETIGLQITAKYSDGQTEILSDGFTVSGDLTSAGTKNISVSYKGKTTYFPVEVKDIEISSIDIQNIKLTRQYVVGDTINEDELSLLAEYNNGTFKEITSGFAVDYDFSSPGTKTVTVSYGGKTTSYEVEVAAADEPSAASLAVVSQKGYSGLTVTVPITLNSVGVYDGNMTIQYDADKLAIDDVQTEGELKDRQVIINKEYAADKIRVSFSGTSPIDTDGVILNLIFNISDNVNGNADISITEAKAYNKSGESVSVNIDSGSVQITKADSTDPTPDENGIAVMAASVKAKPGETVEIPITITDNTGFASLGIEIGYDADIMTLTDVADSKDVGGKFLQSQHYDKNPYFIGWENEDNLYYNGTLAILTFTVSEDAPEGEHEITVDYYKGRKGDYVDGDDTNFDENYDPLGLTYVNGSLTVKLYTPGDVNEDEKINSKDVNIMLRYLAGWEFSNIVTDALDVDRNEKINSKDSNILMRYVAGWDVELK